MNPIDKALMLGVQAAEVGFDWSKPEHALVKVREELAELEEAVACKTEQDVLEEFGDVLFTLIQVARLAKLDTLGALEGANRKFIQRYDCMRNLADGADLSTLSLGEQEALWNQAKAILGS